MISFISTGVVRLVWVFKAFCFLIVGSHLSGCSEKEEECCLLWLKLNNRMLWGLFGSHDFYGKMRCKLLKGPG